MKKPLFAATSLSVLGVCWMAVVGMSPNDPKDDVVVSTVPSASPQGTFAELAAYTIQSLSLPGDVGEPFATRVVLDGQEYTLDLVGKSLRSDDFRLLVQYDDDTLHEVAPPAPRTYKGTVEGVEDAWVAGSVLETGLSVTVAFPDGRRYEVAPLSFYVAGAGPSDQHVVFRASDTILTQDWYCGTDTSQGEVSPPVAGNDDGGIAGTSTRVVDISFDTDAEFYALNGSNVTSTMVDIENIMAGVESVYEAEVDMTYEVTTIIVRTNSATDPYTTTDPGNLLGQFASHWQSTKSDVRRDVGHMMTGRNLDGGTLGIAQLNQTCNTSGAYGLSQSRFTSNLTLRRCVTAHEIGHNFNGLHCQGDCSSTPGGDCRIMCPCVNQCAGDCLHFGVSETNQIVAKRNASACLQAEAVPVAAPFFDDFPSTTISAAKWAYIDGVVANNLSVAPPSSPNALQINALSNTEFADDDIRTTHILLGGLPSATVSYHTQARGVEAGEQLVVEYWAANLRWVELARYTATGTDENTFTFRSHILTGSNALHNEFRLRFRAEVDQANDNWYVDDVSVSQAGSAFPLNIESLPTDGASVLVSPGDINGMAGGITPFTRTYTSGTDVTLIAPFSLNGVSFSHWTVNGVNRPPGQATIVVDVAAVTDAVANYPEPTFTLDVSSVPLSGALILVNPPDENGQASGAAPLSREYLDGQVVILVAPLSHGGNDFVRWVVDGVDQPNNQVNINFTMDADRSAEAIYAPPVTERMLTINSTPTAGVNITVTPLDNNLSGNGTTSFQRFYNDGALVTLTAPNRTPTLTFRRWNVGGVDQPVDQLNTQVAISADVTAVAAYRLIGDANCDGTVDFFDIDPFLMALFDPGMYATTFCDGSLDTVDCDGSSAIDFFDIDAFLAILFG